MYCVVWNILVESSAYFLLVGLFVSCWLVGTSGFNWGSWENSKSCKKGKIGYIQVKHLHVQKVINEYSSVMKVMYTRSLSLHILKWEVDFVGRVWSKERFTSTSRLIFFWAPTNSCNLYMRSCQSTCLQYHDRQSWVLWGLHDKMWMRKLLTQKLLCY